MAKGEFPNLLNCTNYTHS